MQCCVLQKNSRRSRGDSSVLELGEVVGPKVGLSLHGRQRYPTRYSEPVYSSLHRCKLHGRVWFMDGAMDGGHTQSWGLFVVGSLG